jgi:hypothetical protein
METFHRRLGGRPFRKIAPFNGQLYGISDKMCHDDPDDRIQTMPEMRERVAKIEA